MTNTRGTITTRRVDGVLFATIDHPPLNLIDTDFVTDLVGLIEQLEHDDATRVVVLESSLDGFFIPHVDLTQVAEYTKVAATSGGPDDVSLGSLFRRLSEARQVTIAKLRGRVGGAGSELALACDMAFASAEASSFFHPEVGMGTFPGAGSVQHLARRAGRGRTMEIILGGEGFSADEAAAYGWINRSIPDDRLDEHVAELAGRISRFPTAAVRLAKRRINAATLPPKEDVYVDAGSFQLLGASAALQARVKALMAAGLQTRGVTEEDLPAAIGALPRADES